MAGKRTDIMEIRQIINLKHQGYSNRKISDLLSINRNTVNSYVSFLKNRGLDFKELLSLSEKDLVSFFPETSTTQTSRYQEVFQYFEYFKSELKKPGCTIGGLWQWYRTSAGVSSIL
ncbi:hypothetical protein [Aquimarina sp. RZ0]|uniref:terminase gpP N-terminus-related DNA-binding protein n=1 Tax=Aquimarina sp. RZ0 TaxID=2607730 RepID=UPI0011F30C8E|nr:hypothetical protein [Aquimarina sp. RZ0]KAA1244894.1 hypothetical protein F0000_14215 [Aquimarina sp. RZ0]